MRKTISDIYHIMFLLIALVIGTLTLSDPFVFPLDIYLIILFGSFISYYFLENERDRRFSIESVTIFIIIFYSELQVLIIMAFIMGLGSIYIHKAKKISIWRKIFSRENVFIFSKITVTGYIAFFVKNLLESNGLEPFLLLEIVILYGVYIVATEIFTFIYEYLVEGVVEVNWGKQLFYISYTGIATVLAIYLYYDRGLLMLLLLYIFIIPYQQMNQMYIRMKETEASIYKDELTGAYNMRFFRKRIEEKINRKEAFSLIMLDLDRFKQINDTYGHLAGDEALKTFVNTVNDYIRKEDMLFRYAGDEFCILLPQTEHVDGIVHRLSKSIQNIPVQYQDIRFSISSSYGVSHYNNGFTSIEEVFDCADKQMYEQKRKKKLEG